MNSGIQKMIESNGKEVGELRAENLVLRSKLRGTAQILIEAIGADGPMDAVDVALLAATKIQIMERGMAALEKESKVINKLIKKLNDEYLAAKALRRKESVDA
jgi:hypothetical protein